MGCPQSKELASNGNATGMGMVAAGFHEVLKASPPRVSVMTGSWEVARENLDEEDYRRLGEGSFGPVYRSRAKLPPVNKKADDVDWTTVVVKKLADESSLRPDFLTEIQIMKENSHPRLLKLLGVVTLEPPLLMLLESPAKGTLKAVLKANSTITTCSEKTLLVYSCHIAEAMSFLAENKVVHTDLAARNCVVTGDDECKLGDFGLSRKDFPSDYVSTISSRLSQPLRWMSKEAIETGAYDNKSDIYAFGVLLWEIATNGNLPFPSVSDSEVRQHILDGKTLSAPRNCIDGLGTVMQSCWKDPSSRPTFTMIRQKLETLAQAAQGADSAYSSEHAVDSIQDYDDPSSVKPDLKLNAASSSSSPEKKVASAAQSKAPSSSQSKESSPKKSSPKKESPTKESPTKTDASSVGKDSEAYGFAASTTVTEEEPDTYAMPQDFGKAAAEAPPSPFGRRYTIFDKPTPEPEVDFSSNQDVVELQRDQIEVLQKLGNGAFGIVVKGLWHKDDGSLKECAIKTLKEGSTEQDRMDLIAEARLVAQFSHPNVVACYGQVMVGEPAMIVFEFMEHGSLFDFLKKSDDLQLKDKMKMAIDIAQGMSCLEQHRHVHRDIAARNVLVSTGKVCKISDFGLSRDLQDDTYYESEGGMVPIRWTPPEAYKYKKYSSKSDVWSYGILLYEIWTRAALPYGKDWTNLNVMMEVERGFRLPAPPDCPRAIYKVMMDCWNPMRALRPDFKSLVERLKMAYEMLFTADGGDLKVELDTDDLEDIYMGVPVPTQENLDAATYLMPTPLNSKLEPPKVYPTIEEQLVPRIIPRATVPEVSLRKTQTMEQAPDQDQGVDFRKQQVVSKLIEKEPEVAVEYVTHARVAEVLKLSQDREKLSQLQSTGISKAAREGLLTGDVDTDPEYIERIGRARDVQATSAISGRGKCVCRRFKCVCNL